MNFLLNMFAGIGAKIGAICVAIAGAFLLYFKIKSDGKAEARNEIHTQQLEQEADASKRIIHEISKPSSPSDLPERLQRTDW